MLDFVRPTTLPDFSPNDLMDTAAAPAASSGVDFSTPLTILYHDADLVAVYKPAGWLVHRSAIARHEKRFVLQRLRDQIGQHVWPVHRLDQGTCGLLVFALNKESCQQLALAFAEQRVQKTYLALVRGWLAQKIEVLAYCQAKPQDGGEGAVIVLLRTQRKGRAP